jgi:shikimate dehydrogenase
MHEAAFRALGLDWRYVKLPLAPERFVETVRALPGSGYRGINVTIPHKLAALELAEETTRAASAIGAANTLTFETGRIEADNTDAGGFLDALGAPPKGVHATVLGAGGAGRAVAWALREAGAAEVAIWNRTSERAAALAAELVLRDASDVADGGDELLVNATSVGLGPGLGESEALEQLGLAAVDPPPTVVDLVYGDATTPVCAWAARGGARVVDGLEVLVRQGARSFARWTGVEPPLEVMRAAARS